MFPACQYWASPPWGKNLSPDWQLSNLKFLTFAPRWPVDVEKRESRVWSFLSTPFEVAIVQYLCLNFLFCDLCQTSAILLWLEYPIDCNKHNLPRARLWMGQAAPFREPWPLPLDLSRVFCAHQGQYLFPRLPPRKGCPCTWSPVGIHWSPVGIIREFHLHWQRLLASFS